MTTPPAAPRCYRHPDRETYVSCVRCGRPICSECMRPASVGFQCPEEGSAPPVRTLRSSSGVRALARAAPVTAGLIAVNVALFVVFVVNGSGLATTRLGPWESDFVQQSLAVSQGDWWRVLGAMFAHFGILHVASNMFVLFVVGIPLESRLGSVRFAAIYLISGIGGGVATLLFADPLQVSAGASGAIFGVLGAYFVVARRFPAAQLGSVGSTIVINLVITVTIPGISITDHLGGLVVGGVLGAVVGLQSRLPARRAARTQKLALELSSFGVVLLVVLLVAGLRVHALRDRYHLAGAATGTVTAPERLDLSRHPVGAVARAPLPPPRA